MLGQDAKLPPIKGAEYLIDMLFECGFSELKWSELAAWSEMTGTPLSSWESQALMAISKAYTFAISEYNGKEEPAPYQPLDFDRDRVASSVRDALRKKRR